MCNCFDDFRTNLPQNIGRFHQKENTNFPKRRWVRPKNVCLSSALIFSLVVTKKIVLRTSWDLIILNKKCYFSNAESRFGCTRLRRLRLVLWFFTSCVWDVLWYRILIKTAFVSWAKNKLATTTLSTFRKCPFELCCACFFSCNKKICFEKFFRSLYLKQYVFFVQMQSHIRASLVVESCVW